MHRTTAETDLFEVKHATQDEFINSRDAWNSLAESMKYPSIFCTWEWIHTWWNHFGTAHQPVILFIYSRNSLVGILPLFLENGAKSSFSFPRKLGFCGSTRLYPDHLDIICAKQDATGCMQAAFDYLNTTFTAWDILDLPFIAEDSNLFLWLDSSQQRFKWGERSRSVAPYIKINGSFDDFMGSFTSRHRYTIASRRRKFFEKPVANYLKCQEGNSTACLATLFDLHTRRALTKEITSSFSGEEMFRFHEELLEKMRGKNWVWIRFLNSADKPVAALYCFAFANHVFFYQSGQDPDWQASAPGTVIFHEAIREAFDGKYEEFNFLQGEEEYKYRWTKTQRILYDLTVYHGNLPGRAIRIMHLIKKALKTRLGKDDDNSSH